MDQNGEYYSVIDIGFRWNTLGARWKAASGVTLVSYSKNSMLIYPQYLDLDGFPTAFLHGKTEIASVLSKHIDDEQYLWIHLPKQWGEFWMLIEEYEQDRWYVSDISKDLGIIRLFRGYRVMDLDPKTFQSYHRAGDRLLWKPNGKPSGKST